MPTTLAELTPLHAAVLASVPLVYVVAALAAGAASRSEGGWRAARIASGLALAVAVMSLALLALHGPGVWRGPALPIGMAADGLHFSLRADLLGGIMLLLVAFVGWVIVGYSQPYLGGQRGQRRYARGLMLTLAAVTLLVMANDLLILALAWTSTSIALHVLLTFFRERPQALIAAHKKFLASRVADLCLLAGTALVAAQLGTLEIDHVLAAADALPELPAGLAAAAVLFVLAALIKCAMLPVHGWLIQVMEAPTPVSALLHAGVVNLGGFVMIRLGTLVADVPVAQGLLVVVGSITAVVAALVMMTRISIKVSLAWSTCAQMGFMLMQCGLGLYDLALLHIVAHSLYKAYAFLTAGQAVEYNRLQQMTPAAKPVAGFAWLASALVGVGIVLAAGAAWGVHVSDAPSLYAVTAILALALAPLLAGPILRAGGLWSLAGIGGALAVAIAYFGLHRAFEDVVGAPVATPPALVAWVIAAFVVLFLVQGAVRANPVGSLARSLYPTLFAGLYLDELFTRLTFRLWPARLPARSAPPQPTLPEARQPGAL